MALGAILAGFGLQVGRQDKAKLAPKSNIIGYQIEYKKTVQTEWPRSGNKRPPPTLGTTQNGPWGGIKGGLNASLEGLKQSWNVGKGPEATSIPLVAQGPVGFLSNCPKGFAATMPWDIGVALTSHRLLTLG